MLFFFSIQGVVKTVRVVKDWDHYPCLTQEVGSAVEYEMFSDKMAHSKCSLENCTYILWQIPYAIDMEQGPEHLPYLRDYLLKAHKVIENVLFKYKLSKPNFSMAWVLSTKTQINILTEDLVHLVSLLTTGVNIYPHFRKPTHDRICKIFKHVNMKLSNYLVAIDYWVSQMSDSEKKTFGL